MLYFIYCRKSVNTGRGESIENQKEMCINYAKTKFCAQDNELEIYEDEGFSGKNINRPKFKEMINNVELKKPNHIICYRLDRISRNVSDFSTLIEYLNNRKTSLICISEEFDTSKPVGKAMMYIASVFAQLERETIAERVRDNMLMLSKSGRWLGGTTPLGFDSEKQTVTVGQKKEMVFYLKNNDEELIVKEIFRLYKKHRSFTRVANELTMQSLLKRDGLPFSPKYVKQILKNPVYCRSDKAAYEYFKNINAENYIVIDNTLGLTAYNKRSKNKTDKFIIATGTHNGIISGKDWVEMQKYIISNIKNGKKTELLHCESAVFSGLIYCKNCGSRLYAKQRYNNDKHDYICSKKQNLGKAVCNMQNIDGINTDEKITEEIEKIFNISLSEMSQYEKRGIIKTVCKKIYWDGVNLHIFLN